MAITFKRHILPNGLTIMAEVDPDAHTGAVGFFVKAGARDEESSHMGVSHFLEHMMFKGTERRTAEQVNQQFDDIGANYNAFTSHEMTAFFAHVLPECLDTAEDILADIMRPSLREEDFQQERGVILEEIAMYQDHPFWVLYESSMEHYYGTHPLSHRVLGTTETISSLLRDSMQGYFDHRYSADNTVVALAGRVDFDAHVASLQARCGKWPRTGAARHYPPPTMPEKTFVVESNKVNQAYLLMTAPAPSMQDDARYAASILAQILGDVEGSRLYWALVETGLAEDAQAQHDPRDQVGELYTFAVCSPGDLDRVEQTILDEIGKLLDSVDEDDLERVRAKVATAATLAGERPGGRMKRLGRLAMYTDEYRSLGDELARINAVTLDDLHDVAGRFPMKPRVIGRLLPNEG